MTAQELEKYRNISYSDPRFAMANEKLAQWARGLLNGTESTGEVDKKDSGKAGS